jgi:HAD superfamily hydrolase (TIGR01549 family)
MTPAPATLATALAHADAVLFDFDGPLCDVFAGVPADRVARTLERAAGEPLISDDPLVVLRTVYDRSRTKARTVEDLLIHAEVEAVSASTANREGLDALIACIETGRKVGIVSNNSEPAIREFLARYEVVSVDVLVGRPYGRPDLMKPDPWPLRRAVSQLGEGAGGAAFIGDSLTDIEVAHIVGMPCVALANKAGKRARFLPTGAVVIDSMAELAQYLRGLGS